jgi:hypothetical protein
MDKMDIRTLNISIGRSWAIEDVTKPREFKAKCEADFIEFKVDKQKRIAAIVELYETPEKEFKALNDDPRFLEKCAFKAFDLYANKKLIAEFEGDFIDALIWINQNMRRIQQEHGD